MTLKAQRFLDANKQSPVVYGSCTGPDEAPTGCFYRLADGKTFDLSSEECRLVEPRWALEGVD